MACQPVWRSSLRPSTMLIIPRQQLFCSSGFCSAARHGLFSLQISTLSSRYRQKHPIVNGKGGAGFSSRVVLTYRHFVATAAVESGSTVSGLADGEESIPASEFGKVHGMNYKRKAGDKYLLGKSEEDLINICTSLGEQKYRGRQIHRLIYKTKAKQVDDFHHIPKSLKDAFVKEEWQVGRSPIHHIARSADGTIKILLRLEDNRLVETVGIPVQDATGKVSRLTACVSSQVGCALKCTFCATGKGGFARNLRAHEIIEQVLLIEELFRHRVTNVVFMGMGEPLMNLPALLPALRVLNKEVLIGQRMMTISTVGVPNTIARLASYKLQSTLAISLHAPNQELRSQLVPSAKAYPLAALLTDCRNYFLETGRRVSIEYTLLNEVNDKVEHAEELAQLLHRWNLGRHVNVIPYNPIADSEFRRPNKSQVMAFVGALSDQRVTASIRQTRGLDANAACGQLRNDFQKIPFAKL